MRKFFFVLGISFGLLILGTGFAQSSGQVGQGESLGDLARKLRAEQGKSPVKAGRVYTNDNIPHERMGESTSEPAKAAESETVAAKAAGEKKPPAATAHDENYYRSTMKALREKKGLHERELEVLQQQLGLNQTQFYQDPNKTLQQEYSRSDINTKTGEIEKKKQQIADDDKAISDLEDQLRREGAPPGWLR